MLCLRGRSDRTALTTLLASSPPSASPLFGAVLFFLAGSGEGVDGDCLEAGTDGFGVEAAGLPSSTGFKESAWLSTFVIDQCLIRSVNFEIIVVF